MKKRLLFILIVFIAWLPVFVIQKPVFMFYQHALSEACTFTDFLQVMLHGLKLDCTIAGYLTAIPLLLTLVSVWLPGAWLKKVLKGYFLIMGILVSAIFSVDVALYSFWGFRLDATLFFYLQSPADAMASVPLGMFFIQLLVFVAYTLSIYAWFTFILRFAPVKPSFPPTGLEQLGSTFAILLAGGILFIPIRGGVTTSTANVGMVYFSQNQFLNHSAINPCFSLIASLSKQQDFASQFDFYPEEKRKALFDTLIQAQDSLCPGDSIPTEPVKLLTTTRPNILIIIMESFTANAIEAVGGEPGITPNLNRLSKEGVLFTNLYANSFRTDRGLVSVLNGYLAQPTTSIMKYPVKSQTLPSIAKSLNKEGYTADMLYGGDINFTNMQSYFYSSGYSKITADRDFPLSSRLSKWGANDDITFSHLYEDIKQRPVDGKPWLSTFLTLSSHEPFEVPFHHLEHPYLNSVAFTDSCIGNFIDTFKELPAWKSALYIIGGLAGLIFGGQFFVDGACGIARSLGVSDSIIGLTLVAGGTSLPELATSVVAALKKRTDIAIGNVIGSNIFNLLAVLGLTATIAPVETNQINWTDMLVMLGTSLLLLPFMRTGFKIGRGEGVVLLVIYIAYTLYLIV